MTTTSSRNVADSVRRDTLSGLSELGASVARRIQWGKENGQEAEMSALYELDRRINDAIWELDATKKTEEPAV